MCDSNVKALFYVTFETADSELDDILELRGGYQEHFALLLKWI